MPRSVADQCPFGSAKTAKTPFEAALDIVSIIAQSVQPYMVAKMPELRSTFLVMDETAKVIIMQDIHSACNLFQICLTLSLKFDNELKVKGLHDEKRYHIDNLISCINRRIRQ